MAGNNDDCTSGGVGSGGGSGQSEPTDNSSSFTRWSRNLSAHRQLELNRLNQIEKSRRLLELKSQSHLFDQMSASVSDNNNINGPAVSSKFGERGVKTDDFYSSVEEPQFTNSKSRAADYHPDGRVDHDKGKTGIAASQQVQQPIEGQLLSSSSSICGDDDPIKVSSKIDLSTKLRMTSLSSTELVNLSKGKDTRFASPQEHNKTELASLNKMRQTMTKSTTEAPALIDHSMINKPISHEQLAKFVATRVPKNKRAFCMIVRNKMSRINKAKSYFYPTYYLFIQAILDIDNSYRVELSGERNGDTSVTVTTPINPTTFSGDNSFSASSSISADMLFIGANGTGANMSNVDMTGNSYSDNEVYTNIEAEEDFVDSSDKSKTSRLQEQQKLKRQPVRILKSANSLQGRESPLVHPNNLDDSEADRGSLLAWAPDKVKSTNSNFGGGAIEVATDGDEDGDRDDLDEDDSDNEDFNCRQWVDGLGPASDEEANCSESFLESLFDNERNPYAETNGVVLAGRRRKKGKTYLIGTNEYGYTRKNSICKLKSNVLGTQFNAIRLSHADNNINDRCNIVSISYETNVLGFKGPRKMRVFLAKDPNDRTKNLPELFKRDPEAVVYLKNMTPSWNTESQSYVLNFHGRVTQASVKNFQLVQCEPGKHSNIGRKQLKDDSTLDHQQDHHQQKLSAKQKSATSLTQNNNGSSMGDHQQQAIEAQSTSSIRAVNSSTSNNRSNHSETDFDDKLNGDKIFTYNSSIVMQFGRISNDEFTCDVTYPLSILQAFAIALSSFDSKLACE